MKIGLVLEGGAMRGLFTAGVIDVFLEEGIIFDGMVGVSAGAAFGCNFKSKQHGRTLRYNKAYSKDKRYCGFTSLIKTGDIYGAEFCYKTLPEQLDVFDTETFQNNPMEFYVVSTDIETGKPVYKKCLTGIKDELLWFRASASMPLVSRIVECEGRKMLDGGISDSIPVRFFQKEGYEKNVVVLTRPETYRKKKNSLSSLIKLVYKKFPNFVDTMLNRHIMYNETLDYIADCEKEGSVFVLRPEGPLEIGHIEHNPDKMQAAYDEGRRIAKKHINEIKTFLEN